MIKKLDWEILLSKQNRALRSSKIQVNTQDN